MYKHILVPTDGSLLSARTLRSAVSFAHSLGARITFLYVEPDYAADLYGDADVLRMISPEQFDEVYRFRAREILSKAEAVAKTEGVVCDSISCVGGPPHEAIVEAVGQQGCDMIYMSSRGRGGATGMAIGSATLKTLIHAPVPVFVHSVGANASASSRALSVIQDEHQSIGAVIHRLQALASRGHARWGEEERERACAIVAYLRDFPAKLHHPKEDNHLFSSIQQRTRQFDAEIAELRRQHEEESALLAAIDEAVAQIRTGSEAEIGALEAVVERYAAHSWQHMGMEEGLIFAAARDVLTEEDWERIETAFRSNGKAGFRSAQKRLLRSAFTRIVNLV